MASNVDRFREQIRAGVIQGLGAPMEPATLKRLMADERPEAERCQGLQESEARGRWTGLLIARSVDQDSGPAR